MPLQEKLSGERDPEDPDYPVGWLVSMRQGMREELARALAQIQPLPRPCPLTQFCASVCYTRISMSHTCTIVLPVCKNGMCVD